MKIDKDELFKLYMEWVDKVSEENDWKTSLCIVTGKQIGRAHV